MPTYPRGLDDVLKHVGLEEVIEPMQRSVPLYRFNVEDLGLASDEEEVTLYRYFQRVGEKDGFYRYNPEDIVTKEEDAAERRAIVRGRLMHLASLLTEKQRVVFALVMEGYSLGEIATAIGRSRKTVYYHWRAILEKARQLLAGQEGYNVSGGELTAEMQEYESSTAKAQRGFTRLTESISEDTDALLVLDEFYVLLYSLVQLHDPNPDYMGVQDLETVDLAIISLIRGIPEPMRQIYADETALVKDLLAKKLYGEAKDYVVVRNSQVGDLISDGREPPKRIRKVLTELSIVAE